MFTKYVYINIFANVFAADVQLAEEPPVNEEKSLKLRVGTRMPAAVSKEG
jgi:hypothetical protein